jgi:hypothetical protein
MFVSLINKQIVKIILIFKFILEVGNKLYEQLFSYYISKFTKIREMYFTI